MLLSSFQLWNGGSHSKPPSPLSSALTPPASRLQVQRSLASGQPILSPLPQALLKGGALPATPKWSGNTHEGFRDPECPGLQVPCSPGMRHTPSSSHTSLEHGFSDQILLQVSAYASPGPLQAGSEPQPWAPTIRAPITPARPPCLQGAPPGEDPRDVWMNEPPNGPV